MMTRTITDRQPGDWLAQQEEGLDYSKLKIQRIEKKWIAELTDSADRAVFALLEGAESRDRERWRYSYYDNDRHRSLRADAHDLRHPAPRHPLVQGRRLRLLYPRRGPGHQELRHRVGQGGSATASAAPPRPQRHTRREPSGRALEPVRVSQPRDARAPCRHIPRRRSAQSRRRNPCLADTRPATVYPASDQGPGSSRLAGKKPSKRPTASSSRPSGNCTTNCAAVTASPSWPRWTGKG